MIAHALDTSMHQEQAGCQPLRSCASQINTLRIIIEQSRELRSSLYIVFVDFLKAIDKIKNSAI